MVFHSIPEVTTFNESSILFWASLEQNAGFIKKTPTELCILNSFDVNQ